MSDTVKCLRIPVDLHALVIDKAVIENWGYVDNALGSGKWWPRPSDYSRVTGALNAAAPPPFFDLPANSQSGVNPKDAPTKADCGVYLHWVLPERFRRNAETSTHGFPTLPDRWVVVRFANDAPAGVEPVSAWFIDSAVTATGDGAQTAKIMHVDTAKRARDVQAIGAKHDLKGYAPDPFNPPVRIKTPISAVGTPVMGQPAFTATVADNRNLLSFHDPLAEFPDGVVPESTTFSYAVFGWHFDAAAEPMDVAEKVLGGGATPEALLDHWSFALEDGETLPSDLKDWRSTYRGLVAHIDYWNTKTYRGGLLGAPDSAGAHGANDGATSGIRVAVGTNAADALVAMMAVPGAAEAEDKAALWKLLEATVYRKLPAIHEDWQDQIVEHVAHQDRFADQTAGIRWSLVPEERDPNTLSSEGPQAKTDGAPVTASAEDLTLLRRLNAAQKECNLHARNLTAAQHDLRAHWWTLAQLAKTSSAFGAKSLNAQDKTVGAFLDAADGHRKALTVAKAQRDAAHASLTSKAKAGKMVLKHHMSPRFFAPADPVLVFRGLGDLRKHETGGDVTIALAGSEAKSLTVAIGNASSVEVSAGHDVTAVTKQFSDAFSGLKIGFDWALQELALLEAGIGRFAKDLRTASADWPAWLSGVAEAREAKGPNLLTWSGDKDAAKAWRGARLWASQPWSPVHLDWQIRFVETARGKDGFGDGWTFKGEEYAAGHVDTTGKARTLRGRSLLAPILGSFFSDPIHELTEILGDRVDEDGLALSADMKSAVSTHAKTWIADLEAMAKDGIVGQALSGFHQAFLLRSQGAPNIHPDPNAPWIASGSVTHHDEALHKAEALVPPDGVTGGRTGVLQLPTMGPPSVEDPTQVLHFTLKRAGSFVIEHLRLVDDFGQWVDIDIAAAATTVFHQSPHSTIPKAPGHVAQPPRITQPSRFHFRFASKDFKHESEQHPETHPICGWVTHNYLDQALSIAEADGKILGEVVIVDHPGGTSARWVPIGPDSPATPDAIAEPTLKGFVTRLVSETVSADTALQDLLRVIDAGLARTRPSGAHPKFSIAGRPLALVNVELGLHLFGRAWVKPSEDAKPPAAKGGSGNADLDALRLPVTLGQPDLREDGLLGYFIRKAADETETTEGMDRFFPARLPKDAKSGYLADADRDGVKIGYHGHAHLTLLMDPNGVTHGATGILPAKAIQIPAEWITPALRNMELSFRVAPLIQHTDGKGVTHVEAATPAGYRGTWGFRDGAGHEVKVEPIRAMPDFTKSRLTAVEGRLVHHRESEAQKSPPSKGAKTP